MKISSEMRSVLVQLQNIEGRAFKKLVKLPANDLGNSLIDYYYKTDALETRQLIRNFLDMAGVVWLRKLLTNDTTAVVSSQTRFASLGDYLDLLAANDDVSGLLINA